MGRCLPSVRRPTNGRTGGRLPIYLWFDCHWLVGWLGVVNAHGCGSVMSISRSARIRTRSLTLTLELELPDFSRGRGLPCYQVGSRNYSTFGHPEGSIRTDLY